MTHRFYGILGMLLLATQPLFAQEKSPVSVSYRITSLVSMKGKSYSNKANGDLFEITKRHVSNPIKAELREGVYLDFFEQAATSETPPAFSIKLSSSAISGDLLVIILSNEGKIKYLLKDLKALNIPKGGQYVYNLLTIPIAIQCGKDVKPTVIQGRKQKVIPAPKKEKVVQSFYFKPNKSKYTKFSSTLYFKDKGARHIVFCYHKQGAKFPSLAPIAVYNRPQFDKKTR